ncbi:hypothetical protein ACHAW6_016018 [Cyclotella cf. meneghiniana]
MTLRKLFNRRNGIRVVECDLKEFADNDFSTLSSGAREANEYGWEILNDHDNKIDWDSFIVTLKKMPSIKRAGLACLPTEIQSGFILHDAIKLGAPDDVLMFISERFPETLRQENDDGQYPSHVACSFGSSPAFISRCINMCPQAVAAKDNEGKTPLHHLCQSYHDSKRAARKSSKTMMQQTLRLLFRKAPASIVAEDNRGIDAIEYALESNLDVNFVQTLQDLTSRLKENEARKASQRRCMMTRRKIEREHSPHAAYAA